MSIKKYIPNHLSKKDTIKQKKNLEKSKKLYRQNKYFTRPKVKSFKSKKSRWITKAQTLYHIESIKPSKELAQKTKCSIKGLRDIVKKGEGAYYSSGSRPNQSAQSWGIARLGSSITGGPASFVDFHILEKECKKNSKALKLAIEFKKNKNKNKKGGRRIETIKPKKIHFKDHKDFTPNLTPRQIFELGSFGGTYWRPIYSAVTKKNYKNVHKKYPGSWWKNIPEEHISSSNCDISKNKYKVKVGTSLKFWEKKGWINKMHPYGWIHWYCDFYNGKRGSDDMRQIQRWKNFAGPKGRFSQRLKNMIKEKKTHKNDFTVSPKIRQSLQHWAFKL